jgi:tripartite-type tricarboxylate transporter receptor subunit TctC
MRKRFVVFAAILSGLCADSLFPGLAGAQAYPSKAIRLIIPFAAGGPNDVAARVVADELSRAFARPVLAENRPGASGNIGAETAARATPDGYTLFWAQGATHGANPSLYSKLGYDPIRDFAPIALIVRQPLVIVANANVPYSDVKSLIAAANEAPGAVRYGSGGAGTTPHMAAELFAMMSGVTLTHVPYKGNGPAIADTIAGQIDLVFDGINSSLGHIRAGRLKALGVTAKERSSVLADVPTVAEMLPGFEVLSWGGLAAPAGTPREVILRLNRELAVIAKSAEAQERFTKLGMQFDVSSPETMDVFVRAQIETWRKVAEHAGAKLD